MDAVHDCVYDHHDLLVKNLQEVHLVVYAGLTEDGIRLMPLDLCIDGLVGRNVAHDYVLSRLSDPEYEQVAEFLDGSLQDLGLELVFEVQLVLLGGGVATPAVPEAVEGVHGSEFGFLVLVELVDLLLDAVDVEGVLDDLLDLVDHALDRVQHQGLVVVGELIARQRQHHADEEGPVE